VNLSERYFYEWQVQPDGGCPTLDEYTAAFAVLHEREQRANYERDARDAAVNRARQQAALQAAHQTQMQAAALQAQLAQHQAQMQAVRQARAAARGLSVTTPLATYIGSTFARLLMNAAGDTRIVTSEADEQYARAHGWFDPNS
jgi:hypothetical protein